MKCFCVISFSALMWSFWIYCNLLVFQGWQWNWKLMGMVQISCLLFFHDLETFCYWLHIAEINGNFTLLLFIHRVIMLKVNVCYDGLFMKMFTNLASFINFNTYNMSKKSYQKVWFFFFHPYSFISVLKPSMLPMRKHTLQHFPKVTGHMFMSQ